MKKVSFLFATAVIFLAYPALGDDEVRTPIAKIPLPSLFEITEHRETFAASRPDLSHQEMLCYGQITQAFAEQYNAKDSKLQRAITGLGVQKVTFAFIEWPNRISVQPEARIGFRESSDPGTVPFSPGFHASLLLISIAVSQTGCSDIKASMALVMAQAATKASQLDARDDEKRRADAKATAERAKNAQQLADDQIIANSALLGLNTVADSVASSAGSDRLNKQGSTAVDSTPATTAPTAKSPK